MNLIDGALEIVPHLPHRLADGGVDFEHGPEDLRLDMGLLATQGPEDAWRRVGQVQTAGIENLQVDLDAKSQQRTALERKGIHGIAPSSTILGAAQFNQEPWASQLRTGKTRDRCGAADVPDPAEGQTKSDRDELTSNAPKPL